MTEGGPDDLTKRLLELADRLGQIEIENVQMVVEELTPQLQPTVAAARRGVAALQPPIAKPVDRLLKAEFVKPVEVYPGQVGEVQLGAARGEGGTRSMPGRIGGAKVPPFYSFEGSNPNK